MALVSVNPTQLPAALSIGTRKAFDGGYAYHYRFVDEINAYVCDRQTTANVPGEVMAIKIGYGMGVTWYVACEGVLLDGQRFAARQCVFRTTEHFWESGKHEWQLNSLSSATNGDNSNWSGAMDAFAEVPENVALVQAGVGLLEIANA